MKGNLMSNTILLLRYSDFKGIDTIAAHKEVIDSEGSCWWAKLGKQPSDKYLSAYLSQDERLIMLYTPGVLHLCTLGKVIHHRPTSNFPQYYKRDIFDGENEPTTYFELLSITKIDVNVLENYVIRVSGKGVIHDLKKTISSYMMIQDKDEPLPEKRKRMPAKKKTVIYDNENCKSKKNGICKNMYCVRYNELCDIEKTCRRFTPIKIVVQDETNTNG